MKPNQTKPCVVENRTEIKSRVVFAVRYGYSWKVAEAEKNLLRTHTTAVSSRMLYKLAQEGFRPAKYFSIDRVFRNEAVDRTHLAEFHQIEGSFALHPSLQHSALHCPSHYPERHAAAALLWLLLCNTLP